MLRGGGGVVGFEARLTKIRNCRYQRYKSRKINGNILRGEYVVNTYSITISLTYLSRHNQSAIRVNQDATHLALNATQGHKPSYQ